MNLTNDIIKQYDKLVTQCARKYRRATLDTEDLKQAAWARLAAVLPKYDGRVPIGAYVAQHVHWAMLQDLEKAGYPVRSGDVFLMVEQYDETMESGSTDPAEYDSAVLVMELLETLTPSERDFIWRYTAQERRRFSGLSKSRETRKSGEILAKLRNRA